MGLFEAPTTISSTFLLYVAQQTPHTGSADFKVHLLPKLQTTSQRSLRLRNLPHIMEIVNCTESGVKDTILLCALGPIWSIVPNKLSLSRSHALCVNPSQRMCKHDVHDVHVQIPSPCA